MNNTEGLVCAYNRDGAGGMPGLQNPLGFVITVGAILFMGAVEIWAMKKLKWI